MADVDTGGADVPTLEHRTAVALARADAMCAFGPNFFVGQLVRDHCPSPEDKLPHVQLKLADGEILDLCHVVGVSTKWVVLAVLDPGAHTHDMISVLVPFEMVQGVRIRAHQQAGAVGFLQSHRPAVISAENLVGAAFGAAPHRSVTDTGAGQSG
jgi:hypothetical protein